MLTAPAAQAPALRIALNGAVLCILGFAALWMAFRPPTMDALAGSIYGFNSLLNLVALVALVLRIQTHPGERRGWLLLLLSACAGLAVNVIGLRLNSASQVDGGYLVANALAVVFQVWAILAWPWRRAGVGHQLLDACGTLVFAGSLFLAFWVQDFYRPGGGQGGLLILTRAARVVLVGGVLMYVLAEGPLRFRGPLGWLLAGLLAGHGGTLALLVYMEAHGLSHSLPWGLLPLLFPALLALAALSPHPVDPVAGRDDGGMLAGVVIHAPFGLVAALLGVLVLRGRTDLGGPFLMFLGLTLLVVMRQYLLMREIQRTVMALEDRERFMRVQAEDLARINQELHRAQEEKDSLLGVVSHDLRNPLGGIALAAELIQDEEDPSQCRKLGAQIQRAAGDMAALIGRFLDLAALDSGRLKPQVEEVPLRSWLAMLEERHAGPAQAKGITLILAIDQAPEVFRTDPRMLQTVLENLVSNALKFSPAGSEVSLGVLPAGTGIRCRVQDQGPGFTADDRVRMFSRFARLSAQPTGGEKSTGLGLSIVKQMVERLGGTLTLESAPGQGATFTVELPASPSSATSR